MPWRWALVAAAAACGPSGGVAAEDWTCDFDASVARPLGDPGVAAGDGGALPAAECQTTCGPPASTCTLTTLDGGLPGAVCPVCTF